MSLKDHTLFITGASRGIGLAIALRAARDGANIAIAAKTDKPHPKLTGTIFTAADDKVADFSSVGDASRGVDVVAPGVSIVSARDPGVPNWIDTEQQPDGMLVYRSIGTRTRCFVAT